MLGVTSIQTNDIKDETMPKMWQAYENVTHAGSCVRTYQQCCFTEIDTFRAFLADGFKTGYGDDLNRVGPSSRCGWLAGCPHRQLMSPTQMMPPPLVSLL